MKKVIFAAIATAVLSILILCTACTPQSSRPFEPGRKVNVAEEARKSLNSGRGIHSGMDCLALIRANIEWCERYGNCSYHQIVKLQREERRLDKQFRSQCVYDKDQIGRVMRSLRNRGFGGLGR